MWIGLFVVQKVWPNDNYIVRRLNTNKTQIPSVLGTDEAEDRVTDGGLLFRDVRMEIRVLLKLAFPKLSTWAQGSRATKLLGHPEDKQNEVFISGLYFGGIYPPVPQTEGVKKVQRSKEQLDRKAL